MKEKRCKNCGEIITKDDYCEECLNAIEIGQKQPIPIYFGNKIIGYKIKQTNKTRKEIYINWNYHERLDND